MYIHCVVYLFRHGQSGVESLPLLLTGHRTKAFLLRLQIRFGRARHQFRPAYGKFCVSFLTKTEFDTKFEFWQEKSENSPNICEKVVKLKFAKNKYHAREKRLNFDFRKNVPLSESQIPSLSMYGQKPNRYERNLLGTRHTDNPIIIYLYSFFSLLFCISLKKNSYHTCTHIHCTLFAPLALFSIICFKFTGTFFYFTRLFPTAKQ